MKIVDLIKNNKVLILILIIASFFRFYKIDFQSVWLDEIHTLNESNPNLSISEIYKTLLITEPHPPLYFIIAHYFFIIFGYTTIVVRILSVLFGIGGLVAIYLLAKELMNKKVGLIAIAILSVNYFHIYYSQEARMYSMLFFTTTLSYYFLVRLIKKPTINRAILHAIFAALMIYTHFFALFALFAEYFILLFFILKPYNIERKKMLGYTVISGLITLLLYVPALKLFIETTKRTSIWIQMPTVDVYTQMFKEFFGNSEMVLFIIFTLLIHFFINLYNRKVKTNLQINPIEEKQIFSFFILFSWILISLLIPLISTYVKLPMLISRYFINIVPAIIIVIAIGIYYIKNNLIKIAILSIFIIFSFTDIVIVKNYYKTPLKTQFREATKFIADNNNSKDEVISSLAWYLPYFLKNDKKNNIIIEETLDAHVSEMNSNKLKIKSFWYFDGHNRPYSPSEETKVFLQQNFVEDKKLDLFDCFAKHFILKSNYKENIDLSGFNPILERNGESINFSIEQYEEKNNDINLSGWAYFTGQGMENAKVEVVALDEKDQPFNLFSESITRNDVTTYFKSSFNIGNSGFKVTINKKNLKKGNYRISIYIFDSSNKKRGLVVTDKKFNIE